MRAKIKARVENLYHYRCTKEQCAKWWCVAEPNPAIGSFVYCPHCGSSYELIEIETVPKEISIEIILGMD